MAEQVDLDDARKQEILEAERALDGANHFQVLGVKPGATPDEIRQAFHDASRRFHPDRFFNKELGSFRARLERIFRRMVEANSVLSDDQRREAYLNAHPELRAAAQPLQPPLGPEDDARAAERRARMARHPYLARPRQVNELVTEAKALVQKGDLSQAYTQLKRASELDPKNQEVQQLFDEVRKKHDKHRVQQELARGEELERAGELAKAVLCYRSAAGLDPQNAPASVKAAQLLLRLGEGIREAKAHAQRAVDLEPRNASYRTVLAAVLVEAGMKKLAKRELEEALKHDPDHAEAKAQLRKLRWPF